MTKPRIRFAHHVWSCVSFSPWRAGYGYTIESAYRNWQDLCASYAEWLQA